MRQHRQKTLRLIKGLRAPTQLLQNQDEIIRLQRHFKTSPPHRRLWPLRRPLPPPPAEQ